MRKLFTFMAVVLLASFAYAQTVNVDFEPGGLGADWAWVTGENADNPPLEFISNPVSGGINTTPQVAKFIARQGGNPWALCFTSDIDEFTFNETNSTVKIMVYKTVVSNIGIKFEGFSPPIEIQQANTLTDQWEEISFNFSALIGNTYSKLVIIPDFAARTEEHIVYFDNIIMPEGNGTGPLPEPTTAPPTPLHAEEDVISIYSEAYTDLPGTNFNPNWGQSTTVTVDYNAAGNKTLKYENLNYQGTQYANQDVSGFENLHVDFWTPNSTVLNFYVISPGNETPYALPITPETWVTVDIPLSSYVPPVNLADVFQFKVDGNGTVYFDNLYFWKTPTIPGTDATLSDLQVDGVTVDGFSPSTYNYMVELPFGTTTVPTVTATANDPDANYVVNEAASLPGTTNVVVTALDGVTMLTYSVEFTVAGPVAGSEYCETEVWHFNNPAEVPSAIYLTITNFDASSMFVEIESATDDPVDLLIIAGGSGAQISDQNLSVPGKISRTMTWVDTPPTDVLMNILWSKETMPGNWQLSQADISVPFEASCNVGGPAMVKFRVDMSQYAGEFTNAYVSGSFNGWSGDANQLLDPDMDNIYEATLEIENGEYEYKFTLDNWAVQESFSGGEPCVVTIGGYNNRALNVSGNATLPVVCWNSCEACPEILYDVTFSVDMNEFAGSYGNVFVNGSFNGWCGECNMMADPEMDGVYSVTLSLAPGSYEFKYTLDGWTQQEMFDGSEPCVITIDGYNNRALEVTENTVLPVNCWNSCYACGEEPQPKNITFQVDMNQYEGNYNNVFVNGSFNGWCGGCNLMTDENMDGVYETTLLLSDGVYEYKFTLDGWSFQEEFGGGEPCTVTNGVYTNRLLVVEADAVLPLVCWNSCDICPDYQAGWSGISSNVMPEAKVTLENLFAPIIDDMVILLGRDGIFWPGYNINTIGEWDTYQGYKVKFASGVNFEFSGAPLTDRSVTLSPGIYYIPVLSEGPASVLDIISPLGSAIEFMFDISNTLVYWPQGGIVPGAPGALETLEPGFAYLAKITQTVTIDFGAALPKSGSTNSHNSQFINNTGWNNVSATGVQHIISVSTAQLETGDVVGVFDNNGKCFGMSGFDGLSEMLSLVVSGNDVTTSAKDGMDMNEPLTFKIYRNGEELEVSAVYDQNIANHAGLFAENGLSIIREFKLGATGIGATEETSFSIYPNPSNGNFSVITGSNAICNFMVVNIQGQQVFATTISGSATIDLGDQPKGVYFVRLSDAASTSMEKIVIE